MNRTPAFFTDDDGQQCARIPLVGSNRCAILYAHDLDAITQRGYSPMMRVNYNKRGGEGYVRLSCWRGGTATNPIVARLVLGAPPRTAVSYRDGDRFNLRSSNLRLRRGGSAKSNGALSATGGDA